jgi:two-component system OmpR family response regulator
MRILIVEDEKRVAQFLKKGFSEQQFVVDVAEDGERGTTLALSEPYDAIILDVMLPKKSGIAILRDIRKVHITTPVLILSAKAEVDDRVEGLNLGADDYLPKPFSFTEVLARVHSLIRRNSALESRTSELAVADLTMNLLTHQVTRAGKPITLTSKEFSVLEYLMRNRARVLSRVILTEHVWDMDFDSSTNIVDVVINRLRRKVDDGFPQALIHTIRGVGYTLREPEE